MVQQSAAEVNRKVKGDRQVYFAAQSGGHDGEGAHGSQSEGEGSEGEEDWKAPENAFNGADKNSRRSCPPRYSNGTNSYWMRFP